MEEEKNLFKLFVCIKEFTKPVQVHLEHMLATVPWQGKYDMVGVVQKEGVVFHSSSSFVLQQYHQHQRSHQLVLLKFLYW